MITYADASNNNGKVDWTPFEAGCMKSSQGTWFRDLFYAGSRAQLVAQGKPFSAYHWQSPENAAAQARNAATVANHGDSMMMDWEDLTTGGTPTLTVPMLKDGVNAMRDQGFIVWDGYLPRWYWQRMGMPDLSFMPAMGVVLHGSDYDVNGQPSPNAFEPYGNVTPTLNQWSSNSTEHLDNNRYPGTLAQLAALMRQQPPPPEGDDMAAFIISGFANQPSNTQGAVHASDNSALGYHTVPREQAAPSLFPSAVTVKPRSAGGQWPDADASGAVYDYQRMVTILFGPGAPAAGSGLVGAHTHALAVGGTVGQVTP